MTNMVKKSVAILIGLALTATGLWAAGAEEEPAAAADKKYVTDPSTGKVVTAPEYGGTITFAQKEEPEGPDVVPLWCVGVHLRRWRFWRSWPSRTGQRPGMNLTLKRSHSFLSLPTQGNWRKAGKPPTH